MGGDSGKVITLKPSVSVERKSYRMWLIDAVHAPIDTDTGDEFAFKGATFYHTVIVDQPLPTSLDIENDMYAELTDQPDLLEGGSLSVFPLNKGEIASYHFSFVHKNN